MANFLKCGCGKRVEKLTSFLHKKTKVRITICDECATRYELKDNDNFYSKDYKDLTEQENKYKTSGS